MRNTLREFLKLSRPLHSVSVVAKQAPLALSNAKVSCKHEPWLVARVNQRQFHSELPFCTLYSEDVRCFNPFFQIDADFLPVGCPS